MNAMKKKWQDCETAAVKLGCGKTHVHDKLYNRMKQEGVLAGVLAGDSDAIQAVQMWPEFVATGKDTEPMEKLKIAQWYVDKVGGLERAKKLLDFLTQLETVR